MARQTYESRLLREAAYCCHNKKGLPKGLWEEMKRCGLDTHAALKEALNIESEVFYHARTN